MCVCVGGGGGGWGGGGGGKGVVYSSILGYVTLCYVILCHCMHVVQGAGEHVCIYTPPCCIFLVSDSESVM